MDNKEQYQTNQAHLPTDIEQENSNYQDMELHCDSDDEIFSQQDEPFREQHENQEHVHIKQQNNQAYDKQFLSQDQIENIDEQAQIKSNKIKLLTPPKSKENNDLEANIDEKNNSPSKRDSYNQSVQSEQSNCSQLLAGNQRLIFKYPDGSFSYAYKCQKNDNGSGKAKNKDTWLQVKGVDPNRRTNQNNRDNYQGDLSDFQVIQIEDEIEFLVSNLEYLVDPETSIKDYFFSRNILYLVLALNIIFESLLTVFILKNEIFVLHQFNEIYRFYHFNDYKYFFEVVTSMSISLNCMMYLYGFYTVFSHKVTNYQIFLIVLMISIFVTILLTYVNALNIMMFMMKCFTYVYARYVLGQLYTVLIIPNDFNNPQLNESNINSENEEPQSPQQRRDNQYNIEESDNESSSSSRDDQINRFINQDNDLISNNQRLPTDRSYSASLNERHRIAFSTNRI